MTITLAPRTLRTLRSLPRRDRRTMAMIIAMPVILIILFGYAITNEIREAPIAVVDYSHDGASREIIRHISASEYFDIKYLYNDESKIQSDFLSGRIKMAVVFPAGLEADIARGQNPQKHHRSLRT